MRKGKDVCCIFKGSIENTNQNSSYTAMQTEIWLKVTANP